MVRIIHFLAGCGENITSHHEKKAKKEKNKQHWKRCSEQWHDGFALRLRIEHPDWKEVKEGVEEEEEEGALGLDRGYQ